MSHNSGGAIMRVEVPAVLVATSEGEGLSRLDRSGSEPMLERSQQPKESLSVDTAREDIEKE